MSHQLHGVEYGDGTPLIFIHGYTVDHHLLLPFESAFTDHPRWRRIYLDLPGHGRTPAGSIAATADAVAAAVADTVDRLLGDVPFAVCGNSFGGQIARDLVARFGDRVLGLALIAPVVTPREHRRRGVHRTFHDVESDLDLTAQDPEVVAEFTETAIEHTATAWADFNRYVAPGLATYDRAFAQRLRQSFDLTVAPEQRFRTFERPALVITGRQDDAVGYHDQFDLLTTYPRMTYVALDRAGHNAHLDQPAITRALFADWLRRMS
ncbi:alpha/beta hydrolase [Streptomyces sp. NPDC005722]